MPQLEDDALLGKPREQRAQQRRGLEALGKDPAARADESFFAESGAEVAQILRREGALIRLQPRRSSGIAPQEEFEGLAVGEVQPTAPGHQKFARGARHMVEDLDARARAGKHVGRDEAGGSGPDDGARGSGDGLVLQEREMALSAPSPRLRGEGRGEGRGEFSWDSGFPLESPTLQVELTEGPAPHPNPLPASGERESARVAFV